MYISAGNPGDLLVCWQHQPVGSSTAKSAAIETQNKLKVATGDGSTVRVDEF